MIEGLLQKQSTVDSFLQRSASAAVTFLSNLLSRAESSDIIRDVLSRKTRDLV